MKKVLFYSFLFLSLIGCIRQSNEENTASHEEREDEQTILYKGIVKEDGKNTPGQLIITQLIPVETTGHMPFYEGEIILLTGEEVPMLEESTDKSLSVKDIKAGSEIQVELEENAPMTNSLPPQIPGRSIKKVTVLD